MTSVEEKFENPVLTKVHGPLTYLALKTIKDELKKMHLASILILGKEQMDILV